MKRMSDNALGNAVKRLNPKARPIFEALIGSASPTDEIKILALSAVNDDGAAPEDRIFTGHKQLGKMIARAVLLAHEFDPEGTVCRLKNWAMDIATLQRES